MRKIILMAIATFLWKNVQGRRGSVAPSARRRMP